MGRINMLKPRLCTGVAARPNNRWSDHNLTRQQRGYGALWERVRKQVLLRDGGLCQPCLRRGYTTPNCNTVDHIVPKARGGSDDMLNLQCICSGPGSCHQKKTQADSRGLTWDESSG